MDCNFELDVFISTKKKKCVHINFYWFIEKTAKKIFIKWVWKSVFIFLDDHLIEYGMFP